MSTKWRNTGPRMQRGHRCRIIATIRNDRPGGSTLPTVPAAAVCNDDAGMTIDARGLEHDLKNAIEGEVRFDAGSRALYATDASNFRQPPIGVVIPRTIGDVVAANHVCHSHQAPILSRGCGTSLSGETVNYAVVVDFSKHLDKISEPD